MKFTVKVHNMRRVYDAELESNQFLRIVVNRNGEYVLYRCDGLASNGFTPLKSEEIGRTKKLADCKKKAKDIFDPCAPSKAVKVNVDYSHVRMPYKY